MLPCTVTGAGEASAALLVLHQSRLAVHLACTMDFALDTTMLLRLMRSPLMDDHNLDLRLDPLGELPTHASDLARAALIGMDAALQCDESPGVM